MTYVKTTRSSGHGNQPKPYYTHLYYDPTVGYKLEVDRFPTPPHMRKQTSH